MEEPDDKKPGTAPQGPKDAAARDPKDEPAAEESATPHGERGSQDDAGAREHATRPHDRPTGLPRSLEEIRKNQDLTRQMLGPSDSARRMLEEYERHQDSLRQMLSSEGPSLQALKEFQRQQDSLRQLFRPGGLGRTALEEFQRQQDALRQAFSPGGSARRMLEEFQRQQDSLRQLFGPGGSARRTLEEFQRQQDSLRQALAPGGSVRSVLEEFQKHHDLLRQAFASGGSAHHMLEEFRRQQETLTSVLGQGGSVQRILGGVREQLSANRLDSFLMDAQASLQAVHSPTLVSKAVVAAVLLQEAMSGAARSDLHGQSFLLDSLLDITEPDDAIAATPSSSDQLLRRITQNFLRYFSATRSSLGKAELLAALGLIVSIIGLYYARAQFLLALEGSSAQEEANRIFQESLDGVNSQLEIIAEELQQRPIGPIADDGKQYVLVIRNANLRAEPGTASKKIGKLLPHEIVELVEVKGDWYGVRSFDALSGKEQVGWVYANLVRLIKLPGDN